MTPQAAFEQLHRAAAIAPLPCPAFEGPEAAVPSPFRIATAAAAALGLAAAAAAEIWRFRGGDKQAIAVDLGAAAALTVPQYGWNGTLIRPALPASAASGFYHSADQRWLYLHGGFDPRRSLDLLNARSDSAAVLEAVAKWNALALEDALAFLGGSAAIVRTPGEWQTTVAGRLATAPIALTQLAPAPPVRLEAGGTPLGGVKVLDPTRLVAGPLATQLLAEHGAEILAVGAGRPDPFEALYAAGKRRTEIDLAKPSGAEALRRLARSADVFVDGARPGGLSGLGFSPAALAQLAPGIVVVSISAYGLKGPWAGRRGWEETTQAATGLAAEQGAFLATRRRWSAAQPALIAGAPLATLTGLLAAAGVAAALLRRIREGGSWLVEVSLAATAAWLAGLGRIDAAAVPDGFEPFAGLDQYRQSCETEAGRFETLGPVVRMSKTPPQAGARSHRVVSPNWASVHEKANAAEIQSAQT